MSAACSWWELCISKVPSQGGNIPPPSLPRAMHSSSALPHDSPRRALDEVQRMLRLRLSVTASLTLNSGTMLLSSPDVLHKDGRSFHASLHFFGTTKDYSLWSFAWVSRAPFLVRTFCSDYLVTLCSRPRYKALGQDSFFAVIPSHRSCLGRERPF